MSKFNCEKCKDTFNNEDDVVFYVGDEEVEDNEQHHDCTHCLCLTCYKEKIEEESIKEFFEREEAFYKRFVGRTIEKIRQIDSHHIYFKFTDGTAMYVFNKGIHNENEHLHIYDMGNIDKDE